MGRKIKAACAAAVIAVGGCRADQAAAPPKALPDDPAAKGAPVAAPRSTDVYGTDAPDLLVGTADADALFGRGGDDTLQGGDGDDTLEGGSGDDLIEGGGGADVIYGDGGPGAAALEASRFLVQASFGGSRAEIDAVARRGAEGWFLDQLALPRRSVLTRLEGLASQRTADVTGIWWERAVFADDQLRQRVAYALSQITVVSMDQTQLQSATTTFAAYMDHLEAQALGNYEDLIRALTFDPAMGLWLSHIANRAADPELGNAPDENYAREMLQLFTLGTVPLDAGGRPLTGEAFSNADVEGLAAVMTGLSWADHPYGFVPWLPADRSIRKQPMQIYPAYHEAGEKTVLGRTISGPDAAASIEAALDVVLSHPNVPVFVSQRLIQRLVASNPSPAYVARVAAAYETGRFVLPESRRSVGAGRRGDMTATIAAILFDDEARVAGADAASGKLREPVLRLAHLLRAYRLDREEGPEAPVGPLKELGFPNRLGQAPLRSPSVFNFYQADHVAPGTESGALGLYGPELQIMASASSAGFASLAVGYTREGGLGAFMDWDYAALLALADDPAALADELDVVLTRGRLSGEVRSRIEAALGAMPINQARAEADRLLRVRMALALVATAPEYAVQR